MTAPKGSGEMVEKNTERVRELRTFIEEKIGWRQQELARRGDAPSDSIVVAILKNDLAFYTDILSLLVERDALKDELKAIVNDLSFLQDADFRPGELGQRLSHVAANRLKAAESALAEALVTIEHSLAAYERRFGEDDADTRTALSVLRRALGVEVE